MTDISVLRAINRLTDLQGFFMQRRVLSYAAICLWLAVMVVSSGCKFDSSQPADPQQEKSRIEFEVPSDVKADFYGVTIFIKKGGTIDTTDVYYETAKGSVIALNVPARDTSTITINAYKTDSTKGDILIATTTVVVPSGSLGLMKVAFRTVVFPTTPLGLTAALTPDFHVALNWQPVSDAQTYLVSRVGGPEMLQTEMGEVIEASYTDTAIEPAMTYYYLVSARNIAGTSAPSPYVSVTVPAAPEAPGNLQAAATTPSSISLSFSAVNGATGYIILGGPSISSLVPLDTISTTTYAQTGLTANAAYYYAVAALNISGASPQSTAVTATTPSAGPATPTGVIATAASSSSITVTWTAAAEATGYTIYGGASPTSLVQIGTAAMTSFTHAGLTASTTYYYAVAAANASAISARSTTVNATTQSGGGQPPAAPTGVTATATSSTSITVSWTAVTGATSYTVFGGASPTSLSQIGTAATTTYSNTGLTAGTTYYYAVAATNVSGTSGQSTTASATTTQSVGPAAPTGVIAAAASSTSITVSWTAVTGATSYTVYGGTSSSSLSQIGTATAATYTNTGLTAATTYYYAVTVTTSSGTSARSTTVSAATQAAGPAIPTGVKAAAASSTSITVTWTAVTGATSYVIYRGTSSTSQTQVGTSTSAAYTNTGLTASTTYYYSVAAVNASGTSAKSTVVSAATTAASVAKSYITLSKCPKSACNRCRPCPHGAISTSFVVDPNLCVGQAACGQCIKKCPHGAISYKVY